MDFAEYYACTLNLIGSDTEFVGFDNSKIRFIEIRELHSLIERPNFNPSSLTEGFDLQGRKLFLAVPAYAALAVTVWDRLRSDLELNVSIKRPDRFLDPSDKIRIAVRCGESKKRSFDTDTAMNGVSAEIYQQALLNCPKAV